MQSIQEFLGSAFEGSAPSFRFCCRSPFVSVIPFSALKYEICLNKILRSDYHTTENKTPSITNTVKIQGDTREPDIFKINSTQLFFK